MVPVDVISVSLVPAVIYQQCTCSCLHDVCACLRDVVTFATSNREANNYSPVSTLSHTHTHTHTQTYFNLKTVTFVCVCDHNLCVCVITSKSVCVSCSCLSSNNVMPGFPGLSWTCYLFLCIILDCISLLVVPSVNVWVISYAIQ